MENMNPESLLRKAQALGEDIKEMESIDVMGAYQQAQTQIKTNRRRSMYNQLMRYAAFLTIPLLLSSLILGYLYWGATDTEEKYAEVMAATGSVIRYELPDHSVVWLNSGSTLRYPTVFKKDNRNVELKGEAYFEVEADRKRPFYVNTPAGLSVYVYGTKFNVKAYPAEQNVWVTLEEGGVLLKDSKHKEYPLVPGQSAEYNRKSGRCQISEPEDMNQISSWRSNSLNFYLTPLKEIIKVMERQYDVHFIVRDSTLLNNRFTLSTSKVNVDDVLRDLEAVSWIRFSQTEDGVFEVLKKE